MSSRIATTKPARASSSTGSSSRADVIGAGGSSCDRTKTVCTIRHHQAGRHPPEGPVDPPTPCAAELEDPSQGEMTRHLRCAKAYPSRSRLVATSRRSLSGRIRCDRQRRGIRTGCRNWDRCRRRGCCPSMVAPRARRTRIRDRHTSRNPRFGSGLRQPVVPVRRQPMYRRIGCEVRPSRAVRIE